MLLVLRRKGHKKNDLFEPEFENGSRELFLIRTCFFDSATIRKGVFYVNEISTQPIVAGWDMIPVAQIRIAKITSKDLQWRCRFR